MSSWRQKKSSVRRQPPHDEKMVGSYLIKSVKQFFSVFHIYGAIDTFVLSCFIYNKILQFLLMTWNF